MPPLAPAPGGYAGAPMEASRTRPAARSARVRKAVGGIGPFALLVLALGVAGGILLIAAELSNLVTIDVQTTGTCEELAGPGAGEACSVSGFEQHGGALLLLGIVAVVMALGAARGASRPAAFALLVIAVVVLALALLRDVPKTGETGLIGINYEAAKASAGPALLLEILGAVLCAAAAALTLLRRREA